MKQRTGAEWIDALEKVGVPCGPLNNMEQVFAHPQIRHREMQMELEHPLAGSVPQVANPIKFAGRPHSYDQAAHDQTADCREDRKASQKGS